jgi:adenylate kinase family enzyme
MPAPKENLDLQPRQERGVFLLLGVSGSGKGSIGEWLLKRGGIVAHVGMGQWLREAIANPDGLEGRLPALQPPEFQTPTAYLRHCVTNGLLIPDAWTEAVIETQLERVPDGLWALDGYPRTPGAAGHLVDVLEARGVRLLGAVELSISGGVMRERLLGRGRHDDTAAAIARRLEFYEASVRPTLRWLHEHGVETVTVNAEASLETVGAAVLENEEGITEKIVIPSRYAET